MFARENAARARAREIFRPCVWNLSDLRSQGWTPRRITMAVRDGRLLRLRRDRYAAPSIDTRIAEAVRVGGRLTCLSLLKALGVFVHRCAMLHVHVAPGTSRLRPRAQPTLLHWNEPLESDAPIHTASLIDAVCQAVRCQPPRATVATLDSLLHHQLVDAEQLSRVFASLPARFRALAPLLDGSAESGPETYMRLILRALGVAFVSQVVIPGVGRVDFVVDGWLVIECDSREFHAGWEAQVADRKRDIAAARLGYVTVRPIAADIMERPGDVREALIQIIDALRPSRPRGQ